MKTAVLSLLMAGLLAGCAAQPSRLAVSPETSALSVRPAARSVLVGEVAMPDYAAGPEVVREDTTGLIEAYPDIVWADLPEGALANALVRNLSGITGARIARAPWPLDTLPDAELTVRVERMLVGVDNRLQMAGQIAVARRAGPQAEQLRNFDIVVPLGGAGVLDLAQAHAVAWRRLAEEIAPLL